MYKIGWKIIICLFVLFQVPLLQCVVYELTVVVEPNAEECFYEPIAMNWKVNVEFEVVYSSMSDYVIDFYIQDPRNQVIEKRENMDESSVDFVAKVGGNYRFCFKNTANIISEKRVVFEISVEDEKGNRFNEKEFELEMNSDLENKYEIKFANIVEAFVSTQMNMMLIKHHQDKFRSSESRDRHMLENKLRYVSFWSICQISVMVIVGLVQVVMIKSLFDQDNIVHRMLRKLRC